MNVTPGATFEATVPGFSTGLTGTLGVRIRTAAGADFLARTTAGIVEDVTVGTLAVYRRQFTAPTDPGQYLIVWDDGSDIITEELLVTNDVASVGGTANLYITRAQLKKRLGIPSADTQFDDELDEARTAGSRACDGYKHTRFYPTTETRFYTASRFGDALAIDDINELTSLTLDFDGDGVYETEWDENTEFVLEPENYAVDRVPANRIVLNRHVLNSTVTWGRFPHHKRAVKVTGSFGWAETPANVVSAAELIAVRLFKRRETPYAIMSVIAAEAVAAARLGNIDPDAKNLLDSIPGAQTVALASVQLG